MSTFIDFLNSELGIGLSLFILGVLFLIFAAYNYYRIQIFIRKANKTTGTITSFISRGGQRKSYSPVFQFLTLDGRTYTGEEQTSSNVWNLKVGQDVEIYYDPDDPNKARINSKWTLYFFSGLFGILGSVFTITGACASIYGLFILVLGKTFNS